MPKATSYDTVGNREDLSDIISLVAPERTPLYSTLPKSAAPKALYQEWQVDGLDAPTFPGVVDGTDQTTFDNKAKNRARIGNRVQEFREPYMVTRLQQDIATAGVPDEYGRSKSRAVLDLRLDIEACLGSDQDIQVGSGSKESKMRALGKWIDSANTDIPEVARTPAGNIGTTSSLTETTFNAVLQSAYEASGSASNYMLYANTTLKKKISDFHRVQVDASNAPNPYRVNENGKEKSVTLSVMKYDSDWGMVDIVIDLFLGRSSGGSLDSTAKSRGYLIAPGMVSLGYLRNPGTEEFEDKGGGRRGMASAVLTLVCKNPRGLGKFA